MSSITLYNRASTGKIKVIHLSVDRDALTTRWGYLDGAMQETTEHGRMKNFGKENKITPEQNARDLFDRKVKKKMDEGYVEDIATLTKVSNNPWDLPKKFAPAKPKTSISDTALQNLLDKNRCIVSYKRDGQRAFIIHTPDNKLKIMSRRMEDYTEHLPQLQSLANELPPGTIIDVELVSSIYKDDYNYVGSILRSKPDLARNKQEQSGFLYAYAFDILYMNGVDITQKKYSERLLMLYTMMQSTVNNEYFLLVNTIQPALRAAGTPKISIKQIQQALKKYVKRGGEGFVIWDASSPTKIRYDGKPSRDGGAFKMKPVYEDDFFVCNYELGKGKNANVVGALFIFQYDQDGNKIACGKVGGFAGDSSIRRELLNEDLKSGSLVIQVEYSKRNKDGLRFPVMKRIRRDKTAQECIYHKG